MLPLLIGFRTISPEDLHSLIQRKAVTTIDVNTRSSWLTSRVPGALSLDPDDYDTGDLPTDLGALLVFYSSNAWCLKALNAARRAKALGHRDIRVMTAGISGWLAAGLPTESG